jgi:hypothetical protein
MTQPKFDVIIEAVHYSPDGKAEKIRLYERIRATYSDRIIIDRDELIKRLKAHQKIVYGQRIPDMGSTFQVEGVVRLAGDKNSEKIVTETSSDAIELNGIPQY